MLHGKQYLLCCSPGIFVLSDFALSYKCCGVHFPVVTLADLFTSHVLPQMLSNGVHMTLELSSLAMLSL